MSKEKVVIEIGKSGGVTVSVDGVKGESCSLLSQGIVKALGGVESDKPTDEMYERPQEQEQTHYA